jgi:hypothetical protein
MHLGNGMAFHGPLVLQHDNPIHVLMKTYLCNLSVLTLPISDSSSPRPRDSPQTAWCPWFVHGLCLQCRTQVSQYVPGLFMACLQCPWFVHSLCLQCSTPVSQCPWFVHGLSSMSLVCSWPVSSVQHSGKSRAAYLYVFHVVCTRKLLTCTLYAKLC